MSRIQKIFKSSQRDQIIDDYLINFILDKGDIQCDKRFSRVFQFLDIPQDVLHGAETGTEQNVSVTSGAVLQLLLNIVF